MAGPAADAPGPGDLEREDVPAAPALGAPVGVAVLALDQGRLDRLVGDGPLHAGTSSTPPPTQLIRAMRTWTPSGSASVPPVQVVRWIHRGSSLGTALTGRCASVKRMREPSARPRE